MNNIVTFYSYKGGVGRSMALANIATVLASWGFRILIVDFDFEAPGLQYFFKDYINDFEEIGKQRGILNLLNSEDTDWESLVTSITIEKKVDNLQYRETTIDLIISGNKDDSKYIDELNKFNVVEFYTKRNGGLIIENLRSSWKEKYDFTFIDSRTGLTDIGGICTIQLPDILATLFTATEHGWTGVKETTLKAINNQNNLPLDRERLKVLPIPSRIDNSEKKLTDKWLNIFANEIELISKDWLNKKIDLQEFIKKILIPYVPYYSFGEKLAVIEETSNPLGIGYASASIASLISQELQNNYIFFSSRDEYIEISRKIGLQKSEINLFLKKKLDISGSEIDNLNQFINWKNLKSVDLSKTKIHDLSPISNLTKIEYINCSDTDISNLKAIANLKMLNQLNCSNTKITSLLPIIPFLNSGIEITFKSTTSVNEFSFFNCPLTEPPIEIVQKGTEAIIEFFRQKEKSNAKKFLEAKLILLGDGRSGKTSLANRLLGKDLPMEADRTEGVSVNIGEYEFSVNKNETFRIHIWDFAGQDKYKPLHQFFYTESSLYVMVADSGNPKIDYDDWMQTVELFGEGSPLIIVLNEFKDGIGTGSFDSGYWKKQFPHLLKEVIVVNLRTKRNFDSLEKHIQLLAQSLPHTQNSYPKVWADIRDELENIRERNYIHFAEYLEICEKHDLGENKNKLEESALILSSILHKIGVCLHYQNNPLLEQFIILKNEWATEAVYKILEDKKVGHEKCGFFNHEDLIRIWRHKEYKFMRPQLLALMQQFKMAYPLPGEKEYITPPLLPSARPHRYIWPEGDALELYIEYGFLPKALLTQFIVIRHADIDEGRTLVWRNGVALRWPDEALAEITRIKLHGNDAFYIRTQGRNRKGIMTMILNTFRVLHGEYKGIKIKEKVPCNCRGCKSGENRQHYYDYRNLKKRLENNRPLDCDESFEEINILQLLENHFIFEKIQTGQPIEIKEEINYSSQKTKALKIFLASSAELKAEREKIEIAIRRKNSTLRQKNIFIDLSIWENDKLIDHFRSQDNYNQDIDECHCFVLLFYSKVKKYTKEEYERAKWRFENEKNGLPKLRIYQKNIPLPPDLSRRDMNSRFDFMDELKAAEHFPVLYENVDELVHDMEKVMDNLLGDEDFLERID